MLHSLWHDQPELQTTLAEVQSLLLARSQIRDHAVNDLVRQQIAAGGKMLRAALVVLFAGFGKANHRTIVHAAAAIEALHLATLIHDDVIDRSPLRRGQATVQTAATNKEAVYAGDLLFAVYFELLADVVPDVDTVSVNAIVMRRIFMGELDQNGPDRQPTSSVRAYLREASGKTAALIGLACRMGITISHGDAKLAAQAQRFGEHLGLAFQISDDLLDAQATTGKPAFADAKNGTLSLPLIFAQNAGPDEFSTLVAEVQAGQAAQQRFAAFVAAHGIGPSVALQTEMLAKLAQDRRQLPAGAIRDYLQVLSDQLLDRQD